MPGSLIALLVDALAVSRLTRLINEDFLTQPLRDRATAIDPARRHIGYLVGCAACASLWFAGPVLRLTPTWLRRALALSELTVLLREREKL